MLIVTPRKSILRLCDIQIATGLSILTSAFILGPRCGLDAYHWQMIVHLAWFSAVTHLSGLVAMRGYIAKLRWARYIRITLMFSLIVILLVATVPTIFFNWGEAANSRRSNVHVTAASANSTAICFLDVAYGVRLYEHTLAGARNQTFPGTGLYESLRDTRQLQITIFSMTLVVFGFATRLVKLSGPLSMSFNVYIREPLSKMGRTGLRNIAARQPTYATELWEVVVLQPALAVFLMLRLAADLAGSMLAEVSCTTRFDREQDTYTNLSAYRYTGSSALSYGEPSISTARDGPS